MRNTLVLYLLKQHNEKTKHVANRGSTTTCIVIASPTYFLPLRRCQSVFVDWPATLTETNRAELPNQSNPAKIKDWPTVNNHIPKCVSCMQWETEVEKVCMRMENDSHRDYPVISLSRFLHQHWQTYLIWREHVKITWTPTLLYKHKLIWDKNNTVYWKKSFLSTESDTKILQSIYFAYKVGIISSYSNRRQKQSRTLQ